MLFVHVQKESLKVSDSDDLAFKIEVGETISDEISLIFRRNTVCGP